jgi:hypothetical protein
MKTRKIIATLFCVLFATPIDAQKDIDGIYAWDMSVFLKISKGSYQLSLYPIYYMVYGLDKGDSILSEGLIKYESDNFIRLTSKNYEREAKKNITIIESYDEILKDSIKFKFIFPFNGQYKIILILSKDNKQQIDYEFKNQKEIVVPMHKDSLMAFSYEIINQTPVEKLYWCIYYPKIIDFSSFSNTPQSITSNSFEISIPDLTNSYFNRCILNGVYAKVTTCTGGMKCILLNGEDYSIINNNTE